VFVGVGVCMRETWSLVVREEHSHRSLVFENRIILKENMGRGKEPSMKTKILQNDWLYYFYYSFNTIRAVNRRSIKWVETENK
jgi:hypothetical protein